MDVVSSEQLIAAVEQAGLPAPSRPKLKRLRVAGLLHPADQRHPKGAGGSTVVHPIEAVDQLIGVVGLQEQVKKFEHLRFWAFWEGLWVAPRLLRATLLRQAALATGSLARIIRSAATPEDAADAIARKMGLTTSTGPRWLQARVGRDSAQSALYLAFLIAAGGRPEWDPLPYDEASELESPSVIMSAASGMPAALDPMASPFGALLSEAPPIGKTYDKLAEIGVTKLTDWVPSLRAATVAELGEARDAARAQFEEREILMQVAAHMVNSPDDHLGLIKIVEAPTRRTGPAIAARSTWLAMALLQLRGLPPEPFRTNVAAIRREIARMRAVITEVKV